MAATVAAFSLASLNPSALAAAGSPPKPLLFSLRFALAAMLVFATWNRPDRAPKLADATWMSRRIVQSSYAFALLAMVSTLWSIAPATTVAQGIAYLMLVGLLHGLTVGRWRDADVMFGDLMAVALPLNGLVLIGLLGSHLGITT